MTKEQLIAYYTKIYKEIINLISFNSEMELSINNIMSIAVLDGLKKANLISKTEFEKLEYERKEIIKKVFGAFRK